MIQINTVDNQSFKIDGIKHFKNFMPVVAGTTISIINVYNGYQLNQSTIFNQYSVNGVTYSTVEETQEALLPVLYTRDTLGEPILGGLENKTLSTNVMESYGDSITLGQGSTTGNSYIELFSGLYSFTNTNRAVSGRGVWESIRLHNANINPEDNIFTSVMAGFNDVRRGGNDSKTFTKISNAYRGIIVNQFLDRFLDVNNISSDLVVSGTWTTFNSASVGGKSFGKFSQVSGNYMEYTFKDTNVVLAMIGGDGVNEVHGSFDVSIDGGAATSYTLNNQTDGISDGVNNNERSPFILYFSGLEDKEHTIRVTHTDTNNLPIDYFGHLKKPKFCTPLVILEAPKMNAAGYATPPANANDAIIDELNVLINSVASEFSSDYPIYISKTNNFYDVTTGLSGDNIHPNDIGYRQIYNSLYDSLKNLLIVAEDRSSTLLSQDNNWTGLNEFEKQTKIKKGLQIQGTFSPLPTGEGVELEYFSGQTYLTSINRSGLIYKPINLRGSVINFLINGTTRAILKSNTLNISIPTYADDTAAGAGGLVSNDLYKTATGEVRVKI